MRNWKDKQNRSKNTLDLFIGLVSWRLLTGLEASTTKTAVLLNQYDIIDFYPSIPKDHFTLALEFAKVYSNISSEELSIIMNCRTSVLIHNKKQWVKNSNDN